MSNRIIKLTAILIVALGSCGQGESTVDNNKIKDSLFMDSLESIVNKDGPTYGMDEIYQKYVNTELQAYLHNSHPKWSIPSQSKWYPQLFNKYKTDSTLVNYISGDFDCNGEKDYALLLDKGKGVLAVAAFLSEGSIFSTVELTENLKREGEKIEFVLTLIKPGKYDTADPDLEPASRHVNLKCYGIGIGLFSELYDGGKDVYYWDQNELRSCLFEE